MSRRHGGRKKRHFDGEDVSPMSGLSNLSDAMLVLALGILVSLVVHWNVNIVPADTGMEESQENRVEQSAEDGQIDTSDATEFSGDDLQEAGADASRSGEGLERMGTVYYDEASGKYYVVDENGGGNADAGAETADGAAVSGEADGSGQG